MSSVFAQFSYRDREQLRLLVLVLEPVFGGNVSLLGRHISVSVCSHAEWTGCVMSSPEPLAALLALLHGKSQLSALVLALQASGHVAVAELALGSSAGELFARQRSEPAAIVDAVPACKLQALADELVASASSEMILMHLDQAFNSSTGGGGGGDVVWTRLQALQLAYGSHEFCRRLMHLTKASGWFPCAGAFLLLQSLDQERAAMQACTLLQHGSISRLGIFQRLAGLVNDEEDPKNVEPKSTALGPMLRRMPWLEPFVSACLLLIMLSSKQQQQQQQQQQQHVVDYNDTAIICQHMAKAQQEILRHVSLCRLVGAGHRAEHLHKAVAWNADLLTALVLAVIARHPALQAQSVALYSNVPLLLSFYDKLPSDKAEFMRLYAKHAQAGQHDAGWYVSADDIVRDGQQNLRAAKM